MYIVTGAAGFIGSVLIERMIENGYDQVIGVDAAYKSEHSNLKDLLLLKFVPREILLEKLHANQLGRPKAIFHMGARTDTTETDVSLFDHLNVSFTKQLWKYCTDNGVTFIYASSAATYGRGEYGYDDNHEIIPLLKPLNPYGWSKQQIDTWILEQVDTPPRWGGFKFFNVFGPNEYHKGRMASVVFHGHRQIRQKSCMELFESNDPNIPHGMQKRDFIYVKDVVDSLLKFYESAAPSAIYNLGSGKAHTFLDLARAVFLALNKKENIKFIPMPPALRNTYQNFTQANMQKATRAGIFNPHYSFEEAIREYVEFYLEKL